MDEPAEPSIEPDADAGSGPAGASTIVVEAVLTLEDWAAWLAAWASSVRARVGALRAGLAPLPFVLGAIAVALLWRGSRPLVAFFVGCLSLLASLMLQQRVFRKASLPKTNGWVLGPFRLDVSPEGIRSYRSHATTIVRWAAVLDVTRTKTHVFIWLDSISALVVPVRDLGTLDADRLVAELRGLAGLPPLAPSHVFTPPSDEDAVAARVGFWGVLMRRLAWQPVDDRTGASDEWIVAVGAALATAVWIGLDRIAAGSRALWTPAGLSGLAWYALGIVAVVWVLRRASTGRVHYRSLLAAAAGALPAVLAVGRSIHEWVPDPWKPPGYVALTLAVTWLVHRCLVSAAGWAQPRALLLSALAAGAFAWASTHVYVYPHFFYSLDAEDEEADADDDGVEQAAFEQGERIDAAAEAMAPGRSGRPDVFFLGFAGVAEQKVFAEELKLAERVVARRYDADRGSLLLVNDRRDREAFPIATGPGLARALRRVGERMDDQDVLFLMLTSHGSSTPAVSVTNGDWPFADLDADALREALASSGIRWRVIVISACYSGAFVAPLADENTIVVTSSAADRTSFGCSDDNDVTDFGGAFVRDALPGARSLADAFETARAAVESSEKARGLTPSLPQMRVGRAIEAHWAGIEARRH
jgi:hypothetical protein